MNTSSTPSATVLVIEDQEYIREIITDNLTLDGFTVLGAGTIREGTLLLRKQRPDVIVLDIELPDGNGFKFCSDLRRGNIIPDPHISNIPVLMLTAYTQDEDQLRGFDMGADDYVSKPFVPEQLTARLRAIVRRTQATRLVDDIAIGKLTIDLNSGVVRYEGEVHDFAPIERNLLLTLARSLNEVLSREDLLRTVWSWEVDGDDAGTRTVDVHVNRLRARLAQINPEYGHVIRTVRGVGYMLQSA